MNRPDLSLSYDIVKAHGGELNVATREGSDSLFSCHHFLRKIAIVAKAKPAADLSKITYLRSDSHN
jgi:hypothetical protein